MRFLLAALIAVLASLTPLELRAHALEPGFLELSALGEDRWRATWRKPDVNGRPMAMEAVAPEGCTPRRPPPPRFDGKAWTSRWVTSCEGGLAGGAIAIDGLDRTRTDVLVRYELAPGRAQAMRLTPASPSFVVPAAPTAWAILLSYGTLGVDHILQGVDHLLFVFALLLLIPDLRRLIGAVTAFTVAHSISLASATLGWLVVPAAPVEAIIALSIVFLAAQLARPASARDDLSERRPWIVAFAFGLLHGLGFASALQEVGLPDDDIPLALFAFNIGVEVGQLLFIAALILCARLLSRLYPRWAAWAAAEQGPVLQLTSHAIGGLGAFWVLDRAAGF